MSDTSLRSMTGFAALKGALDSWSWAWEIRAVNARGLDMRLRLPDWIDGLEPIVRKGIAGAVARGNVSLSLKMSRQSDDGSVALNVGALTQAITLLAEIEAAAKAQGLPLAPTRAVDIAGMRNVVETAQPDEDVSALRAALTADIPVLLAAFNEMRAHEGAALATVVSEQLDAVETLVQEAETLLAGRSDAQADTLKSALERVVSNSDFVNEDRVEQELALIAVKSDVREEIDRLTAHVAQARALLSAPEPCGRKLDFLMQEFNREANTLCSKAGFQPLTRVGLDLKALIDQMREQVQNIE